MANFEIVFLPEGKVVPLAEATPLSDAAELGDLLIDHPCGANATCGKCRVRFVNGAPEPTAAEARLISAGEISDGWRLSCQSVVERSAKVEIPHLSRVVAVKGFGPENLFENGFDPFVRRKALTIPEPDLDYQWALEDSLAIQWGEEIRPQMTLEQLRDLGNFASSGVRQLTAIFDEDRLLSLKADEKHEKPLLGLAIDLGSTSVAGALVDLETGAVKAYASTLNPQVRFGGDVISRIEYAQTHADGNEQLRRAAVEAINGLLRRLLEEAAATAKQVWAACVAGNPAMLHTLVGVEVNSLGQAPYVGAWTRGLRLDALRQGIELAPHVPLRVFPMIRSNVGGDTVAAIIASGMDVSGKMSLLIDLGTNCEVVLGNRDGLIATSTAAGPAFEGANIRQGMRAAPGAIDRVSLRPRGRLAIRVIGNVKAKGICGSGLIDAAAALLRTGLIDPSGRMHSRESLDSRKYPELASRIVRGEHGHAAVILATHEESERGVPVMLTALDIRQLQLIKGSILAGAALLLQQKGMTCGDLDQVLIAGAFGSYIRKASAVDIGLVPPIDPEKIHFIGNAAGVGARMALVDRRAWRRAEQIRESAEYLELGGHRDYQEVFAAAMGFHDSPAVAKVHSVV
ncbi:MAG: ASKHA domain-containing protein [bacterium]